MTAAQTTKTKQNGEQASRATAEVAVPHKKEFLAAQLPNANELIKYLLVELDVPRANHVNFQTKMRELTEIMFGRYKWELVFAAYPIAGTLNRFVHIWRIPDESDLLEVMREGALQGTPAQGGDEELQKAFRDCYQEVQNLITHTEHRLMTSLPYDPTHVGHQTQTILIDTNGDRFLIDHEKLREHAKKNDADPKKKKMEITADLEKVRRGRVRVPRPDLRIHPRNAPANTPALDRIQAHLNRGTSLAVVDLDGKKDALLFNLAGIKARSVFQSFDDQGFKDALDEKKAPKFGRAGADFPVSAIVLATPWGSVYRLDETAIETVAKVIPNEDVKVTRALEPILQGNVPLAAIPEERDEVIGDGCACYIINLKSFVSGESGTKLAE